MNSYEANTLERGPDHFDALARVFLKRTDDYAVLVLDDEGRILSWNHGAQIIFGFPAAEMIGQDISRLFSPEARLQDEPRHYLEKALEEGRAIGDGWLVRKDGTPFFAGATLTVVADGGQRCLINVVRDLTSRKEAEEEQEILLEGERAARAEAELASQMKDEFLATISHELRTPLTAILLWSRILHAGQGDEKDRQEAIETIQRSATAQSELIEDLLDISRMISGKLRLSARRIELSSIVEAAVAAARPMAEAKGVVLATAIDPQAGFVRADPARMQRVVANLLANSVRFTPPGGQITVELGRWCGHLQIRVIDTGQGISTESLPVLFDRLKQCEAVSTRQPSGLGLGLAIARQLVELHGGTIRAESMGKGKGATFTVELPAAAAEDVTDQQRSGPGVQRREGRVTAPHVLAGLRVLLVEDEADTRNVIRWLLEQSGADVTAVDSVSAAMKSLTESAGAFPDVLVSDLGMADEDGCKLIRDIRLLEAKRHATAPMPALAVTAHSRDEDRCRALAAGFGAFMAKPVDPNELVSMVATLAGRDAEK